MAGVLSLKGYEDMLGAWLKTGAVPAMSLRLYTNNYTPVMSDSLGLFTELAVAGYAPISLVTGNWTIGLVAGQVVASYIAVTFVMTAAFTVYGYYATIGAGGGTDWEFGEKAAAPITFGAGGGGVYVQLNLYGPTPP
jgi:hypothetical protein